MSELPQGWAPARIGELASKIGSGATPRGGVKAYKLSGTPLLRSLNVHFDGVRDEGIAYIDDEQAAKLENVQVETADVLLNITGASIGRVAIAPERYHGARVNQHVAIIRTVDGVEPSFLSRYLASPDAQSRILEENYGVTRQALTKGMIEDFPVCLPPLPEQRRIVAKLDRLSARSAAARAHLARTTKLATRAKQAIWDQAFSGRMTASWRGTAELTTWRHLRCSEACDKVQSGGTPKKDGFCDEDGIPFLKVYNIVNQKVAFEYKPQFLTNEAHNTKGRKSKLKPGDVLMNIVGPPLGKVAIVPDTYSEWNCNQAITVFRPSKIVSTEWIYHFLCSGISVASVVGETRGVVGQVNISLTQCRNFVIPVPPVDEQVEIVRRIESAFTRIDRLTEEASRAAHLLDRLDERLLAKAFRGELVPQEPEDEPAEALLTRIREARAAAPKAKRGRRKKADA